MDRFFMKGAFKSPEMAFLYLAGGDRCWSGGCVGVEYLGQHEWRHAENRKLHIHLEPAASFP
jgi:hypothetical protein